MQRILILDGPAGGFPREAGTHLMYVQSVLVIRTTVLYFVTDLSTQAAANGGNAARESENAPTGNDDIGN